MTERVCPECGSAVVLLDTLEDVLGDEAPGRVYVCTTAGCHGRIEVVSDDDAAAANEPTGGDNIGA